MLVSILDFHLPLRFLGQAASLLPNTTGNPQAAPAAMGCALSEKETKMLLLHLNTTPRAWDVARMIRGR
jgi:hypothetical protein